MHTALLSTGTPADLEIAVAEAVRLLQAHEVVGLPTETVYGLAGDALEPLAVAKIFEAKARPAFDPLICHLPDASWLARMADVPPASQALVARLTACFWPGPLTLVLPRQPLVPDLVTSGLGTVALRMSAHPVFAAVVQRFGRPLAAPSANRFGRISPTTGEHVRAELEGRIPLILEGGPTRHGLESTIVAVEGASLRMLRSGPVTSAELAEYGPLAESMSPLGVHPEAPGQLLSHYAPTTPMHLVDEWPAPSGSPRVGFLAWREAPPHAAIAEVLSPTGDLREAAATLFAKMRRLDSAGLDCILAQAVPEAGLGSAIMDRLRKAAAAPG